MKAGKIINWILIALVVVLGIQNLQAADGVEVKQAQAMSREGALLLDVREPDEFSAVHVQEAKLIPLGQLSGRLGELSEFKSKPIVVMCRSGRRSAKAVEMLREAGFTQVSNIKGGINTWEGEGLPVVKM
ncbi:MAG: rhodanese-like domain-containing protein [Pseudomonadota bacterium]